MSGFGWTYLALILGVFAARAAVPPGVIEGAQAVSPERVRIRVVETNQGWFSGCGGGEQQVDLRAEVLSVTRSNAGLEPGQTIEIRYAHRPLGDKAGPAAIPILKTGWVGCALLAGSVDQGFAPAARSGSFLTTCP